jgi:hypothetical protein
MNKAFVKEPEMDGRAYCPRCQTLGVPVAAGPLDTHIQRESRAKMHDAAWFCCFPQCEVAYFNVFETAVLVDELKGPVYPKDPDAPLCACFDFDYEDVLADARDDKPTRIRELLARSQSEEARCHTLAADGQCCMREVQRLYMKLRTND